MLSRCKGFQKKLRGVCVCVVRHEGVTTYCHLDVIKRRWFAWCVPWGVVHSSPNYTHNYWRAGAFLFRMLKRSVRTFSLRHYDCDFAFNDSKRKCIVWTSNGDDDDRMESYIYVVLFFGNKVRLFLYAWIIINLALSQLTQFRQTIFGRFPLLQFSLSVPRTHSALYLQSNKTYYESR